MACLGQWAPGLCELRRAGRRHYDARLPVSENWVGSGRRPEDGGNAQRPRGPCAYLGAPVLWGDGQQATRECESCQGKTREKLFVCNHPRHAADPTTTIHNGCGRCRDWEERKVTEVVEEIVTAGGDAVVNYWRGGGD